MREIKFRGKRIDNGEWVYGYLLHVNGLPFIFPFGASIHDCAHLGDGGFVHFSSGYPDDIIGIEPKKSGKFLSEVIPETVGQYIGLPDKNGSELFEGDIVDITTTGLAWGNEYTWRGEIILSRGAFVVKSKDGKKDKFTMFAPDRAIEHIGNIHDNA